MSRFTTLYTGSASDAAEAIADTDAADLSTHDIKAALVNALRRIADLEETVEALAPRSIFREDEDGPDDSCTHPGGHVWNRSAGEADEARISGDHENDNIRCIHCGADGDA